MMYTLLTCRLYVKRLFAVIFRSRSIAFLLAKMLVGIWLRKEHMLENWVAVILWKHGTIADHSAVESRSASRREYTGPRKCVLLVQVDKA